MKLLLVTDEGKVIEALDAPEGYNLNHPMGATFFLGAYADKVREVYDPFAINEESDSEDSPLDDIDLAGIVEQAVKTALNHNRAYAPDWTPV